jgi:hypothetical protein
MLSHVQPNNSHHSTENMAADAHSHHGMSSAPGSDPSHNPLTDCCESDCEMACSLSFIVAYSQNLSPHQKLELSGQDPSQVRDQALDSILRPPIFA